jgi:hypothetical protein
VWGQDVSIDAGEVDPILMLHRMLTYGRPCLGATLEHCRRLPKHLRKALCSYCIVGSVSLTSLQDKRPTERRLRPIEKLFNYLLYRSSRV